MFSFEDRMRGIILFMKLEVIILFLKEVCDSFVFWYKNWYFVTHLYFDIKMVLQNTNENNIMTNCIKNE